MTDQSAACAHLHIEYIKAHHAGSRWNLWRCRDCLLRFVPAVEGATSPDRLRPALLGALSTLRYIDENRHEPRTERERAAVAEIKRVIRFCSEALRSDNEKQR